VIPWACRREADAQQAAMTGRWTAELRVHVQACGTCEEIVSVAATLAGLTATDTATRPPRSVVPARLWAEAQQARRLRAEVLVSRIVVGVQMATALVVVATLATFGSQVDIRSVLSSTGNTLIVVATAGLILGAMGLTSWLSNDA
jgi:predicted alpha/beta hydrolase family esterase